MWSPELSSHLVSSVTSYCMSNRTKGSWVLGHERGAWPEHRGSSGAGTGEESVLDGLLTRQK